MAMSVQGQPLMTKGTTDEPKPKETTPGALVAPPRCTPAFSGNSLVRHLPRRLGSETRLSRPGAGPAAAG